VCSAAEHCSWKCCAATTFWCSLSLTFSPSFRPCLSLSLFLSHFPSLPFSISLFLSRSRALSLRRVRTARFHTHTYKHTNTLKHTHKYTHTHAHAHRHMVCSASASGGRASTRIGRRSLQWTSGTQQHTAQHCTTLQHRHPATHCNTATLQHISGNRYGVAAVSRIDEIRARGGEAHRAESAACHQGGSK